MASRYAQSLLPWLFGFFVVFNLYLFPSLEQSPRVTDALGVVFGLWLFWLLTTVGVRATPLIALLIFGVIPLLWGMYAFSAGDALSVTLSVRWLLAIPWGYALFAIARNSEQRLGLVWGLWWGCVANVVVLVLQFYGFEQLTQNLGLAAQDSLLLQGYGMVRNPGMHGHPNASTAVVSLIVPASLYLYYSRKAHIWVMLAGLGLLCVSVQFTLTRSPLLVSLVTVLVVFAAQRKLNRSLSLIALLLLTVPPILYWVGPPGGWERWLDYANIESSLGARSLSNFEALRISLESPLGIGYEAAEQALWQDVAIGATHNAFLQIGVVYGLILAGAIALTMFALASRTLAGIQDPWSLEAMVALQLFGLFFFEEHLNNPVFIVLTNWLIAASVVQIVDYFRVGKTQTVIAGQHMSQHFQAPR